METAFYSEIKAQPAALRKTIAAYEKNDFALLHCAAEMICRAPAVIMSGMGTSYNVCLCALKAFGHRQRVCAVQSYQLLQTDCAGVRENDLLILISQSGESGEVVELCKKLNGKNRIIGITNDPTSTLALASELVLPLYSAPELSITNSTFTASMAVLLLLSAMLDERDCRKTARALSEGAYEADKLLSAEAEVFAAADSMGKDDRIHFIGCRGIEMSLAEQAALTFKEGANCNAQSFNVGAFRHGPMELCGKGHVAVLYAASAESAAIMTALVEKMRSNGSRTICITNQTMSGQTLRVCADNAAGFGMAAAVVTEMLLVRAAENRGKEAGVFHIAGKICREI